MCCIEFLIFDSKNQHNERQLNGAYKGFVENVFWDLVFQTKILGRFKLGYSASQSGFQKIVYSRLTFIILYFT